MRCGHLGQRDDQVGQQRVGLVVDERAAVDPAGVAARPRGRRRPAPPSPTRTGRRRGRRRRPGPRTTAVALTPAEPIGTSSASSTSASAVTKAGGRLRLTASRIRSAGAGRGSGLAVSRVRPSAGDGDGAGGQLAVDPQGDVDGPVGPALAVLAGAVERVDDPDPGGATGGPALSLASSLRTASSGRSSASRRASSSCDPASPRAFSSSGGRPPPDARSCEQELTGLGGQCARQRGVTHDSPERIDSDRPNDSSAGGTAISCRTRCTTVPHPLGLVRARIPGRPPVRSSTGSAGPERSTSCRRSAGPAGPTPPRSGRRGR